MSNVSLKSILIPVFVLLGCALCYFIGKSRNCNPPEFRGGIYQYDSNLSNNSAPYLEGSKITLKPDGSFSESNVRGSWTFSNNIVSINNIENILQKIKSPSGANMNLRGNVGQLHYGVGFDGNLSILLPSRLVGDFPPIYRKIE